MTQVNAAIAPVMTLPAQDVSGGSIGSIISSLANVSPSKVNAFADQAFLALGKDGVSFLPFLTSLIKAFQGEGGVPSELAGTAPSAEPAEKGIDTAKATLQLVALRNDNAGVEGIDKAIAAISKSLPQLSESEFSDLLKTVTKAAQPATPGGTGTLSAVAPKIDSVELGLINDQIAAAKNSGGSEMSLTVMPERSPTGNRALDSVLSAIKDIAKDGIEPGERSAIAQVLASLVAALLPPEKGNAVLGNLGPAVGPIGGGMPGMPGINVSIGIGGGVSSPIGSFGPGSMGGGGFGGFAPVGSGGVSNSFNPAGGYYGSSSAFGGRGKTFDPMVFFLRDMQTKASQQNFNPMSTSMLGYNALLTALQDSAQRGSGFGFEEPQEGLNGTSFG